MLKKQLTRVGVGGLMAASYVIASSSSAFALVGNDDIVNGAVTSAKIAYNTITGANIAFGGITGARLANGAVTNTKIAAGSVSGSKLATDIAIASDVTRATSDTGSFQNLAGDLTLEGAAGGTSAFLTPVMGHVHGDTLVPTASGNDYVYHAGMIGAYSVTTSDTAGTKAGVIGAVGVDGATTVPDAAVMAVLDSGDGAATTANAAYGVAYTSPASGSHFNYGLDLYHAAFSDVGSNSAVDYGVADIRLSSGATISSGASNPGSCVKGSINLNTNDGKLYTCSATNTWVVTGSQS